ncbi:MAG: FecR domain-containing protein [Kiritimatiellae bacterium]|nr:FecR domain-containing protein [Kiritimatiellia bacterium]
MSESEHIAELIRRHIEGLLTDSEREELELYLDLDREARRAFVREMKLHASLSIYLRSVGARKAAKPAATSSHAIVPHRKRRLATAPRALPLPRPAAPRQPRRLSWWPAAIAAALLVGIGFLVNAHFSALRPIPGAEAPVAQAPTPGRQPAAFVQRISGQVYVTSGLDQKPAVPAQELYAGDKIMTVSADAAATIVLGATAQLELRAGSSLTVGDSAVPDSATAWLRNNHAFIQSGTVLADVTRAAGTQTILTTPHAEVDVVGTRFALEVATESTRVDMQSGRVQLRNTATDESLPLDEGHYALLSSYRTVVVAKPSFERPPMRPERVREGLLALYTFQEGKGFTVRDVSGRGAPLNLHVTDWKAVRWLPEGGLAVERPATIASPTSAGKIIDACRRNRAVTVELWITPRYVPKKCMMRHVLTFKNKPHTASLTLGMRHCQHNPQCTYEAARQMAKAKTLKARDFPFGQITHVVYTQDAGGAQRLYVNGCVRAQQSNEGLDFANWSYGTPLTLANEVDGTSPWLGDYHLVAVYDRALKYQEVKQNYEAGVVKHDAVARR